MARLAGVCRQSRSDLLATLAWIRELVSMIQLARFTGAPAARAEELVAQIAAAVEGISSLSPALEPARQSVGQSRHRCTEHSISFFNIRSQAMSIFSRTRKLVAATLHDCFDRLEDPQQLARQSLCELETDLGTATSATARSIAAERLIDCAGRRACAGKSNA